MSLFLLRHHNLLGFFEEVSKHVGKGEPIHIGYLDVQKLFIMLLWELNNGWRRGGLLHELK